MNPRVSVWIWVSLGYTGRRPQRKGELDFSCWVEMIYQWKMGDKWLTHCRQAPQVNFSKELCSETQWTIKFVWFMAKKIIRTKTLQFLGLLFLVPLSKCPAFPMHFYYTGREIKEIFIAEWSIVQSQPRKIRNRPFSSWRCLKVNYLCSLSKSVHENISISKCNKNLKLAF